MEKIFDNSLLNVTFSASELERYKRHLLLPEVGIEGQKQLKNAKVLIIGIGGLGLPCSFYLAAAGVGTIGIMDFDTVELSNLQRQVFYKNEEIGTSKIKAASVKL